MFELHVMDLGPLVQLGTCFCCKKPVLAYTKLALKMPTWQIDGVEREVCFVHHARLSRSAS